MLEPLHDEPRYMAEPEHRPWACEGEPATLLHEPVLLSWKGARWSERTLGVLKSYDSTTLHVQTSHEVAAIKRRKVTSIGRAWLIQRVVVPKGQKPPATRPGLELDPNQALKSKR